ncbi:MAG: methyltransferase domain-containing protein [Chloroflexi bacterium]|nr:methyltransferase domain-containing protein [Chloroflexota bacterium]
MKAKKTTRKGFGFWPGLLVGLLLFWVLARPRVDLNQVARAMYNFIAPYYDPLLELSASLPEVRQMAVDRLELRTGDRALEVSVGTGANLPYIARRIGSTGQIFGIDISEGMLAQARKKLATVPCPVELQLGNAEDLPYADGIFDAVLNLGAMNFITDRKKAIDEMVRVAKPGAKIVFADETLGPDGPVRGLLSQVVFRLVPRLRPPINLVPEPGARLSYSANGFMYIIDWRKPSKVV